MPKTPKEIESMQGRWKYVEKLKAENKRLKRQCNRLMSTDIIKENQLLKKLLKRNKIGDCWCDLGDKHSKLCIEIQKILETE